MTVPMTIEHKQDAVNDGGSVYFKHSPAGSGQIVVHVVPASGTKVKVVIDTVTGGLHIDQFGRLIASWALMGENGKINLTGRDEGSDDPTNVWFSWTRDGSGNRQAKVVASQPSTSNTITVTYTNDPSTGGYKDADDFHKWMWYAGMAFVNAPDWSH